MGCPRYQTLQRLRDLIVLHRVLRTTVGVRVCVAAITRLAKGTISLVAKRYAFSSRVSAAVFTRMGVATLSGIDVNLSQAGCLCALTVPRFFHQIE